MMINTLSPLLTDFYEMTMAYGYWQLGRAEQEAVFTLFFRKNPFGGDYTIACGLQPIIDFLSNYRFSEADLSYLSNLKNAENKPLFSSDFIDYLAKINFSCHVDAVREGYLVFPNEPIVRVQGPLLQCQLLETALINHIQFSSLIATKATRIRSTVGEGKIIDFGLRRSQGPNGGLLASRAAHIGGCDSTSNTLAGFYYGIPVKGTVAHSWIMAFPDELTAFRKFAQCAPDNCVLLVDTFDTISGVRNAITVGKELRAKGYDLLGVRLDSGDLATLSKSAREMLDSAGFANTQIVASGELDEYNIKKLIEQNAAIDVWGVGTHLLTAFDQPALDVVYKLTAIREKKSNWTYKMKLSNQPEKMTLPGIQQVRRYYQQNQILHDTIYDEKFGINASLPSDSDQSEDILVPIFDQGELVYESPSLTNIRSTTLHQIASFKEPPPIKLEPKLDKYHQKLMQEERSKIM